MNQAKRVQLTDGTVTTDKWGNLYKSIKGKHYIKHWFAQEWERIG